VSSTWALALFRFGGTNRSSELKKGESSRYGEQSAVAHSHLRSCCHRLKAAGLTM
jgi:hypothetical protein